MVEVECINIQNDCCRRINASATPFWDENMPTYEYRCLKCKRVFEIFHKITSSIRECPHCGGKLERLITPNAGLIFKGTGFYQTDYKKQKDGNGKDKEMKEKVVKEDKAVNSKDAKKSKTSNKE